MISLYFKTKNVMKIKSLFILATISCCFGQLINGQNQIISEEILIKNDSVQLPGTLTYNSEDGPQPLIIFVHGSGNVDRNGNQAMMNSNANYIKILSDSLVNRNISFYRFDKRTATSTNIPFIINNMIFEAFAEDVDLVVNYFKEDKRFSSITLIGHSQGSLVAMLVKNDHVSKYISLAGPSKPIDVSIIKQVQAQNGDSLATIVKSHFKELSNTGTIENIDPNLMGLFNKPTQPFIKSWMAYNPSEEIKNLKIPVLVLNGDKDLQVSTAEAEELHAALPSSELKIIKDMNHVLKTITDDSDNLKSYSVETYPLSTELVSTIEAFVKK